MYARLPMYDLPELREASQVLYRAVADELRLVGVAAPRRLSHDVGEGTLVLGQVCGYPFARGEAGAARLVATPRYRAPGCEGPTYRSVIVVRATDPASSLAELRGRRCARNEAGSHSGDNALRYEISRLSRGAPFFGGVVDTGSHADSVEWVRSGGADVAAIDCVTWALLGAHRPSAVDGLRVLAWTAPAPALPFVTELEAGVVRAALGRALQATGTCEARQALLLDGIERLAPDDYRCTLELEAAARDAGYPELA